MVEQLWACIKCKFAPKIIDEQSKICPNCGDECILVDYIDEKDMVNIQGDLMYDAKKNEQHLGQSD